MPWTANTISVATTAVVLVNPSTGTIGDPVPSLLFNNDPTNVLYIGPQSTVSTSTGFPVRPLTGISFRLHAGDTIYGISAQAGGIDARVMIGRQ